jgi:class 3 adenylate cyclase
MLRLGKAESIAYVPIIKRSIQSQWEKTTRTNNLWSFFSNDENSSGFSSSTPLKTSIWNTTNNSLVLYDSILAPISQITPLEYRRDMLLLNCLSDKIRRQAIQVLLQDSRPVISRILDAETEVSFITNYSYVPRSVVLVPIYRLNYTKNTFDNETIGMVMIEHSWDAAFRGILQGTLCIRAVVENICGDQFTLVIRGGNVKYIGNGDLHDPKYDDMMIKTSDDELLENWAHYQDNIPQSQYYYSQWSSTWILRPSLDDECRYTIRFYPTDDYHDVYVTSKPIHYSIGVVFIFLFTILCFLIYDYLVEKRQSVVMNTAVASSDIVNQLYPPSFVRRVIHQSPTITSHEYKSTPILNSTNSTLKIIRRKSAHGPKELSSLKDILLRGSLTDAIQSSSHIFAEMFTDVSIIFADISGFTAWSSEREPVQVFQLLEALYSAFDEVGKKLGIFKVETIGDCYVAVVGLPTPRPAHAVVMCRFAHEIHKCISSLTKELEVQLGPGTSDLQLRIGIHSGPVTAGILRGEKSRFQLFGDTMNTAARMESTGKRGKTQVSQDTAKLLTKFGKQHWLTSREELVYAKGKGELQTYWFHTTRRRHKSTQSNTVPHKEVPRLDDFIQPLQKNTSKMEEDWGQLSLDESCMDDVEGSQKDRLIEWNTEMLCKMLCRLESKRRNVSVNQFHIQRLDQIDESKQAHKMIHCQNELHHAEESTSSNSSVLDSTAYSHFLQEIMGKQDLFVVTMPNYDGSTIFDDLSVDTYILSDTIRKELKQFVTDIAEYYNPLPFRKLFPL